MGIFLAAIIATVLSAAILGLILFWRRSTEDRRLLLVILIANLPMSAMAFHGARRPIESWLASALQDHQGLLTCIRLCYAPLTEEPAKLLVLVVPLVWRRVTRTNLVHVALAIGLGFGIGEAWMLAGLLSAKPEIAAMPWYGLQGFIMERTLVCMTHAAFTSMALLGLIQRRWGLGLCGIAAGMACHFATNFPIWLAGQNTFGWGRPTWDVALVLWVQACVVASVVWLFRLADWRLADLLLRYRVKCPECGAIYKPPLVAINLLDRRYEKCPACRRWHYTTAKDRLPREQCRPVRAMPGPGE